MPIDRKVQLEVALSEVIAAYLTALAHKGEKWKGKKLNYRRCNISTAPSAAVVFKFPLSSISMSDAKIC